MSKYGEGTGVPMGACDDPNNPSYDPATCYNASVKKMIALCENAWENMTKWERDFVMDVYGKSPLTRKQHITISKIYAKYIQANA